MHIVIQIEQMPGGMLRVFRLPASLLRIERAYLSVGFWSNTGRKRKSRRTFLQGGNQRLTDDLGLIANTSRSLTEVRDSNAHAQALPSLDFAVVCDSAYDCRCNALWEAEACVPCRMSVSVHGPPCFPADSLLSLERGEE